MAGFKVSEFSGVANTTADSLLLLSYTTDNGSTFATRKIRIADFLDDIDRQVEAGVAAEVSARGQWTQACRAIRGRPRSSAR